MGRPKKSAQEAEEIATMVLKLVDAFKNGEQQAIVTINFDGTTRWGLDGPQGNPLFPKGWRLKCNKCSQRVTVTWCVKEKRYVFSKSPDVTKEEHLPRCSSTATLDDNDRSTTKLAKNLILNRACGLSEFGVKRHDFVSTKCYKISLAVQKINNHSFIDPLYDSNAREPYC